MESGSHVTLLEGHSGGGKVITILREIRNLLKEMKNGMALMKAAMESKNGTSKRFSSTIQL